MRRLIDANALSESIKSGRGTPLQKFFADACVATAPTVDAVEVVHGRWIERPIDNFRKYEVKCSECGFVGIGNYDQYLEPYDLNYCPNCGAKMDLEE